MAQVSGLKIICYWYLLEKSSLAAQMLPPIERLPLAQAVVQLLVRMREFEEAHGEEDLLRISADGRVDAGEINRFRQILGDLEGIVSAAIQVDCAEREAPQK